MYLFDSNLSSDKQLNFSLTRIFGLGHKNSKKILKKLGFLKNLTVKILTKTQIYNLVKIINSLNLLLSHNLKKFELLNFKNSLNLKLIKSFRKLSGLPTRGQRTRTNAKTAKKIKLNF